jgi:phage tail sheath protein FI
MPSALTYPGVYIEEVPSGVRTIAGVSTSIAAFVGYTRMGEPDKAVHLTSFGDFERSHGGLSLDSPLSYGIRQFFMNGGTEAYVVRVAVGHATAQWQLADGGGTVLEVRSASPGTWGNDLRLEISYTDVRNADAEFNLIVSQLVTVGGAVQTVVREQHRNLNMNSHSPDYVVSKVNNASQLIHVDRSGGLVFANPGFAVSDTITFPLSVSDNIIEGIIDGDTAFRVTLASTPANIGALVSDINTALTNAGLAARLQAEESDNTGNTAGNGALRLTSQSAGEFSSVLVSAGAFGGLASTIGLGLANGGRSFTGNAEHRPLVGAALVPSSAGADGSKGAGLNLIGSQSGKTGIYALRDVDLFNLLCIPETRDLPETEANAVIAAAASLCEQERAFYIVDAPSNKVLTDIATWAASASQSRNAATYFPALQIADPLDSFRAKPMAPSGTVAGVYARTDSTRGIWKAPAGTDASLNGVAAMGAPMNDIENGTINTKGVNALRSFPAYGKVVWGARTMKGSDAQADEYKYIPVRRLALYIEESLYRGTQWVVFEPNDEPLWAQIRLNVGAFMQNLFRQGAFQGATPREAYLVKCDRETTTQNDINLGIVNILVGFAPLKPAEFVIIKLQQLAGQVEV